MNYPNKRFPHRKKSEAGSRTPRREHPSDVDASMSPESTASPVSGRRDLRQRSLSVSESDETPVVIVKSPSRQPLYYRKRIATTPRGVQPGDLVAVRLQNGTHLGYGITNPRAELALRMITTADLPPGEPEWSAWLQQAVDLRTKILQLDDHTNAYRVIHAEGDRLSGLVVDRYGDILSAEAFSIGMYQRAEAILNQLGTLCGTKHWVLRCAPFSADQEGFWCETVSSPGCPDEVVIQESGTKFLVRFREGHKTGFFCDQRDHRLAVSQICRGKSVLDLCCYTGGFSIQAAVLGQASEVTGVDLDEEALVIARRNAQLNQARVVRFVQADAFAYMRDMQRNGKTYDVVVLDPPKLIRHRGEMEEGTRMHFDLNRLAMSLVKPGGVILTCTCSGLLSEEAFHRLVLAAARYSPNLKPSTIQPEAPVDDAAFSQDESDDVENETREHRYVPPRPIQILRKSGAASDHPIAAETPESDYLKALLLRLG
ncbi:MAG: class I SAM-dependent rRNA methyltransferase [Planctomycetaceae bacterium]